MMGQRSKAGNRNAALVSRGLCCGPSRKRNGWPDRPKFLVVAEPVRAIPAGILPVEKMLARIRPDWRAKRLIERVTSLLHVDPSSACQWMFAALRGESMPAITIFFPE